MSKKTFLFGFFVCLLFPVNAWSAQGSWASADQVRARLISGVDSIGATNEIEAALEIQLSENWHTYWKMPGDAGLPARFDWSKSQNFSGADIFWPAPVRKQELDFQVFGYDEALVLPLILHLDEVQKETTIDLTLNIMVCHEICIPQELNVKLDLPAADNDDVKASADQRMIDYAKRKIPFHENDESLRVDTTVIGPDVLAINAYSSNGFQAVEAIAYTDTIFFTTPPEIIENEDDPHHVMLRLTKPPEVENLKEALSGKTLHIFIADGRNALEHSIEF